MISAVSGSWTADLKNKDVMLDAHLKHNIVITGSRMKHDTLSGESVYGS